VSRLLFPHLAVFVAGAAFLRVAVVPAEVCPPVDAASARASVAAAVAWLERGELPGGRYTYGYDRERGAVSGDYNITRHAGVMMALYQAGAVRAGDHGLPFVRANLVRSGDWVAFAEDEGDVRLGASALAAAALLQRRLATGEGEHDELIRGLARFLAAQQLADGSILGSWRDGRRVPGEWSKFGTGEALWALALADRAFPGEGWGSAARRLARYVATRRDDVEGYTLPFPDHWAAYGLAELDELGEPEVAYARTLAGTFGLSSRAEAQSGPDGLRRLFRGEPASGSGLGTIGEGLAQLRRLAGEDARLADLAAPLDRRLRCTAGRIADRQERAGGDLVRGAWFDEGGYTQMDDQQHALSALLGFAG
jgi:hypothetical protein